MNNPRIKIVYAAVALIAMLSSGCQDSDDSPSTIDLTERAAAAARASGYTTGTHGSPSILHIYTWTDYISPDVVSSFERALDVKVSIDTFDSNEAMYAKLKAGATGYDLLMPSSFYVTLLAREGLIRELDHTRLPNVRANFDTSFSGQLLDHSLRYSVPYAVTYSGLFYIRDKMPDGITPDSWAILGNPAFKNRLSLLDDMREVIGAALMFQGHSINSTNPAEIEAATQQILAWRRNVRKFECDSYKSDVPSHSTWLAQAYSSDVLQVIDGEGGEAREDLGFILPKEGFSIGFDECVISATARQEALAHAFVNYLYDACVAQANMEYISAACPVKPGIDRLQPDFRKRIVLTPEELKRGQVAENFTDRPEIQELYNRAWDRIRSAK